MKCIAGAVAVFLSLTLFLSAILLLIAAVSYVQGGSFEDVWWAVTWAGPVFILSLGAGVFWRRDIFHLVWSWAIPLP